MGKFLWQFAVIELKILVCRFESEMVPKWMRTSMRLNLKVYEAMCGTSGYNMNLA